MGHAAVTGYKTWIRARDWAFTRVCRGAFASFGPRSVVQPPLRLIRESRISIGSDVIVGLGSWLQVINDDAEIVIGDGTLMPGFCTLSASTSIRIGKGVGIGRYALISDHQHEFINVGIPFLDQGTRDVRPIEICDGVWLGQSVFVGPGVRIGRGSVVGANSVVISDIPDYSVAVGAPARVVRSFGPESAQPTEPI